MDELIIAVFLEIDNFCKKFIPYMEQRCLPLDSAKASLEPLSSLTLSEIMTICTVFHLSGYRTFKWYYTGLISGQYRDFFPHLVSYYRFVELMPYAALPMTFFVCLRKGECTVLWSSVFVTLVAKNILDCHLKVIGMVLFYQWCFAPLRVFAIDKTDHPRFGVVRQSNFVVCYAFLYAVV